MPVSFTRIFTSRQMTSREGKVEELAGHTNKKKISRFL